MTSPKSRKFCYSTLSISLSLSLSLQIHKHPICVWSRNDLLMDVHTAQKVKFSIKDFVISKSVVSCDLVTFTDEIPNGKLHFLCCAINNCKSQKYIKKLEKYKNKYGWNKTWSSKYIIHRKNFHTA